MLFTEIIKENKDFINAYKRGRFVSCNIVTCYYRQNKLPVNRIGITVSKKLGNAVARNRAKRIIRAAYRLTEKDFPIGYDLIFVARNDIAEKKSQDIEQFFKTRVIEDMNKTRCEDNSKKRFKKKKENLKKS